MALDSTAKISEIITALQDMQGINQREDLKSVLASKGITNLDTDSMATLISKVNSSLYASNIKSIQRGIATLISRAILDVAISSVDLTKAVVIISVVANGATATTCCCKASFSSETVLQLRTYEKANLTVYWTVVEFSNIKSLQQGAIDSLTSTTNISITSVDINKSLVFASWYSSVAVSSAGYSMVGYNLTSPTNLKFECSASSFFAYWFVVEFN